VIPQLQRIAIALGAGAAAGLLFVGLAQNSALPTMLAYLSPLPIMIATLGWGADMGFIAICVAAGLAAALLGPWPGADFAATVAMPSWLLATLVTFRRARPPGSPRKFEAASIGLIVAAAAAIGALVGASELVILEIEYGDYDKGVAALAAKLAPFIQDTVDGIITLPAGFSVDDLAALLIRVEPAFLAASMVIMLAVNLYVSARAVQLSQRLVRTWTALPENLVLPPVLGFALCACIGVALAFSGTPRHVAWIGVGALAAAYLFQGFAVAHALSRGLSYRTPLLFGVYVLGLLAPPWTLSIPVTIGLLESLLSLRARRAATLNPKT
jgi:hypothetical protein